jgi:hypothetical protein
MPARNTSGATIDNRSVGSGVGSGKELDWEIAARLDNSVFVRGQSTIS